MNHDSVPGREIYLIS